MSHRIRLALLGAGLHNQLLALRLLQRFGNSVSIELFDNRDELEIKRTISGHTTDIPAGMHMFLQPYWTRVWPSYDVHFGSYSRRVPIPYASLNLQVIAEELKSAAQEKPESLQIHLGRSWTRSEIAQMHTPDLILDSTPQNLERKHALPQGVQQFVGRCFRFPKEHGIALPTVVDARVPQNNGFCFMYILPFSSHELFLEDTRLLEEAQPHTSFERGLADFVFQKFNAKLDELEVVFEEAGALPIPLTAGLLNPTADRCIKDEGRAPQELSRVLNVGFASGAFHPTTGYSLPFALRSILALEQDIARHLREGSPQKPIALAETGKCQRTCIRSWGTFLLFNLFFFRAFSPAQRVNCFAYFYRLPRWFIARFYAGDLAFRHLALFLMRPPPKSLKYLQILGIMRSWSRAHSELRQRSKHFPTSPVEKICANTSERTTNLHS